MDQQMISRAYVEFCESLWLNWRAGRLELPPDISTRFEIDHMPEPYVRFGDGIDPFYVLFTNPGCGMAHQHRDAIMTGQSCIDPQMTYRDASLTLGEFYKQHLPHGAALARIKAMDDIREHLGRDCIVQFESLPLHSSALPCKDNIPRTVRETKILDDYLSILTEAMKSLSVMALSAVTSSRTITRFSVADSRWLSWQAQLLGINPTGLTFAPLVEKGGKTTSALLYQKVADCTRGFVLTMGGNTLPAVEGRERLVHALVSGR